MRSLATLLALFTCIGTAHAQTPPTHLPGEVFAITSDDIAQAAIAFVNFSNAPGISSATFQIDEPGQPMYDLVRTALGFQTDITLRDFIFDGFVAAWLGGGGMDQHFDTTNPQDEDIQFDAERAILSARVSGGISLPITRHFRIRPYVSLIGAHLETEATITGEFDLGELPPPAAAAVSDNNFDAAGIGGTVQLLYDRWFDTGKRLEIDGVYTAAYTETFNVSDDLLEASGTSETVVALVRYSAPTGWVTGNRPWRWNAGLSYTSFIDQPKRALGFTYYYHASVGVDYELNLKPLNWFGLRFVGVRGGIIFGDNIDGWSLGISFQ